MPRAPKACPIPGCPRHVVDHGRCAVHRRTPWVRNDNRPDTTDSLWRYVIRPRILARDDARCYLCGGHATEVDHIIPKFKGGSTVDDNLAAICHDCHVIKSAHEGVEARRPPHTVHRESER